MVGKVVSGGQRRCGALRRGGNKEMVVVRVRLMEMVRCSDSVWSVMAHVALRRRHRRLFSEKRM